MRFLLFLPIVFSSNSFSIHDLKEHSLSAAAHLHPLHPSNKEGKTGTALTRKKKTDESFTLAESVVDAITWGLLWEAGITALYVGVYHFTGVVLPTIFGSALMVGIQGMLTWGMIGTAAVTGAFMAIIFVVAIKVLRTLLYSLENDMHFLEGPKNQEEWEGKEIFYEGVSRKDIDHLFGLHLMGPHPNDKDSYEQVASFRYFVYDGFNMNVDATRSRKYKTTISVDLTLAPEYPLRGKNYRLVFTGLKSDGTRYQFHMSHTFGFKREFRPYSVERDAILSKGLDKYGKNPKELDFTKVAAFAESKENSEVTTNISEKWAGQEVTFQGTSTKVLEKIFRVTIFQGIIGKDQPTKPEEKENDKKKKKMDSTKLQRVGSAFFFLRRPEEGSNGWLGGGSKTATADAATAVVLDPDIHWINLYAVIETLGDDGIPKIVHVTKKFEMHSDFVNFMFERNRAMSKGIENLMTSGAYQTMEDAIAEIKNGSETPVPGRKETAIMQRPLNMKPKDQSTPIEAPSASEVENEKKIVKSSKKSQSQKPDL